ncbi:MAG: hypothetical protein ACEQSX_08425 [Baekduiaceae bacterium]
MSLLRCALALVTVIAVAACAPAAGAQSAPKVPKVKTRIAKVQINTSGYVETRVLRDTTSDCFPGERWIQTNRYDFSTGGFVNISMKRITGDGFDPIVTSPFSKRVGSATVAGKISEYKTTNYCTGEQAKNTPAPTCSSTSGKTSISMQEGVVPKADDEDLTPLTQTPLMLAIQRTGGGRDADGCIGPGASQVTGEDTEKAVVTTSMAPSVALNIPSGLSVIKVFNIRPGQRFRRSVIVSGPCSSVALRTVSGAGGSPSPGNLNADGDCFLTGKITYTITPRPKPKG